MEDFKKQFDKSIRKLINNGDCFYYERLNEKQDNTVSIQMVNSVKTSNLTGMAWEHFEVFIDFYTEYFEIKDVKKEIIDYIQKKYKYTVFNISFIETEGIDYNKFKKSIKIENI